MGRFSASSSQLELPTFSPGLAGVSSSLLVNVDVLLKVETVFFPDFLLAAAGADLELKDNFRISKKNILFTLKLLLALDPVLSWRNDPSWNLTLTMICFYSWTDWTSLTRVSLTSPSSWRCGTIWRMQSCSTDSDLSLEICFSHLISLFHSVPRVRPRLQSSL